MKLLRYDRAVGTIFDLLGRKEDDMTYALGFVAARSHAFAVGLAKAVGATAGAAEGGVVRLQTVDAAGRTDVELFWPSLLHIVFEAKRGPTLPTKEQLGKYTPRLKSSEAARKLLVAVTNAPDAYARVVLPREVDGIPLAHLAWRRIRTIARTARTGETNQNKNLLDEFDRYLTEILGMEIARSNMVYVVSLGNGAAWGIGFKEAVSKHRRYFFPTKGHWPSSPPNYVAFRFDGQLQSIHHVDDHGVFTNPQHVLPTASDETIEPHFLLHLGPPIVPPAKVPTGPRIPRSMRVWCMLDLLLTSPTITDARDETKKRLGADADGAEVDDE